MALGLVDRVLTRIGQRWVIGVGRRATARHYGTVCKIVTEDIAANSQPETCALVAWREAGRANSGSIRICAGVYIGIHCREKRPRELHSGLLIQTSLAGAC